MYLKDVLEEHAEEAAFLWMIRQQALRSWNYTATDLTTLDERLAAHLDGLHLGRHAAAEILEPYLTDGEEGEAFAAAYIALASGTEEQLAHVFGVFEQASGEALDGIRHALRHTKSHEAVARLAEYHEADAPAIVAAAIDVLSYRGAPYPFSLTHLHRERAAEIRIAALEAIARTGAVDYLSHAESALDDDEPQVRRAALRAGFVLNSGKAIAACRNIVAERSENADEALHLLGLWGLREDQASIFGALADPALQPHAVLALSAHGFTNVIDRLLGITGDMTDQRGVGCVVSRITGVDIEDDDLESWSKVEASRRGETPTFEELEAEFTSLEDDPYEGLPPPDLDKLTAWWHDNATRFDGTVRLLRGALATPESMHEVLENGSMPVRYDAALELRRLGIETSRFDLVPGFVVAD